MSKDVFLSEAERQIRSLHQHIHPTNFSGVFCEMRKGWFLGLVIAAFK